MEFVSKCLALIAMLGAGCVSSVLSYQPEKPDQLS